MVPINLTESNAPPQQVSFRDNNINLRTLGDETTFRHTTSESSAGEGRKSSNSFLNSMFSRDTRNLSVFAPPKKMQPKRHNHDWIRWFVRQVKNLNFLSALFLLVLWMVAGSFVLIMVEGPEERQIEAHLRSVYNKCNESKIEGVDIVQRAIEGLDLSPEELSALRGVGNGPWFENFCDTLNFYDHVEGPEFEDGGNNFFFRWDFPSTLFYFMMTFTTIGYGNLTPSTRSGQFW